MLLNNASTDVTAEGLLGGTAGAGVLIHNTNTTNNNYANLDFRAQDGDARIAVQRTATNTSQMHFVMDNAGTALNAMTIKNDGNLGIGTTNPVVRLHAHHTTPSDGSRTSPITMLRLHRTKSGAVEYTGFGSDTVSYTHLRAHET